jgi:hypothetical protein
VLRVGRQAEHCVPRLTQQGIHSSCHLARRTDLAAGLADHLRSAGAGRVWLSNDIVNLGYIRRMVSSRPLLLIVLLVLQGCASHSSTAVADLSQQGEVFNSTACQNARQNAWLHDDLKTIKTMAGPALLIIAGPVLLVPVLFANVGLSTADHLTANDIKAECGGRALTADQVTQRIALDAGMSVLTGAVIPAASAAAIKP